MSLHVSESQAHAWGVAPQKKSRKKVRRPDGYDSQLEADFAALLHQRQPLITRWKYHPWQFVLGHGPQPVRYTPDFLIVPATGRWEIIEVKGFWRPKDRVIIKMCADQWPEFAVYGVMRDDYGYWQYEEFSWPTLPGSVEDVRDDK